MNLRFRRPLMMARTGKAADLNHYNLVAGLATYKTALASGLATILITGDSIGVGQNTTDPATKAWANLLKAQLYSLYGGSAGYYICSFDNAELALWTLGTGWTNNLASSTSSYGYRGMFRYSTGGGTLSIALTGTDFDFYAVRGAATVAHTVTVDSEAPLTMGAYSGPLVFEKQSKNGLASASHTIVYAPGAAAAFGAGIMVHTAATGIIFDNSSVAGYTVTSHINPVEKYKHRALIGFNLTIIPLTINDYINQTALATYTSQLDATVAAIRPYGNVLLVAENASGTPKTIPQSSYAAAMKTVAVNRNCGFIDINGLWGSYAAANAAGLMFDVTHPNDAGHQKYYDELAKWLL